MNIYLFDFDNTIVNLPYEETIEFLDQEESLDPKLNFTFTSPQKKTVNVAMSNSFGFGGHNACVIFRKLD